MRATWIRAARSTDAGQRRMPTPSPEAWAAAALPLQSAGHAEFVSVYGRDQRLLGRRRAPAVPAVAMPGRMVWPARNCEPSLTVRVAASAATAAASVAPEGSAKQR